jgi:predicted nucleic acid-binding Zn ribbon protein
MDDAQLKTVWQQRQFAPLAPPLGVPLAQLMKRKLAKRVKQLNKLAEVWDEVLPQPIREHTALESFKDGVLTVIVDSAPHRFQLQTLLNAGLTSQIQELLPQALNKIRLIPGQFYSIDISGAQRYQF